MVTKSTMSQIARMLIGASVVVDPLARNYQEPSHVDTIFIKIFSSFHLLSTETGYILGTFAVPQVLAPRYLILDSMPIASRSVI